VTTLSIDIGRDGRMRTFLRSTSLLKRIGLENGLQTVEQLLHAVAVLPDALTFCKGRRFDATTIRTLRKNINNFHTLTYNSDFLSMCAEKEMKLRVVVERERVYASTCSIVVVRQQHRHHFYTCDECHTIANLINNDKQSTSASTTIRSLLNDENIQKASAEVPSRRRLLAQTLDYAAAKLDQPGMLL